MLDAGLGLPGYESFLQSSNIKAGDSVSWQTLE